MANIAEREQSCQREKRGKAIRSGLITAGCVVGGITLFGYSADRVLTPDVAKNGVTTEQCQSVDCDSKDNGLAWLIAAGLGIVSTMTGAGRVAESIARGGERVGCKPE